VEFEIIKQAKSFSYFGRGGVAVYCVRYRVLSENFFAWQLGFIHFKYLFKNGFS
jgi:hypothetical protein